MTHLGWFEGLNHALLDRHLADPAVGLDAHPVTPKDSRPARATSRKGLRGAAAVSRCAPQWWARDGPRGPSGWRRRCGPAADRAPRAPRRARRPPWGGGHLPVREPASTAAGPPGEGP